MMSRRRMTLQLTPLLDLLLIVMFSQYIENRDRTLEVQAAESKRDQELADLKSNLEAAARLANAEREQEFAIRGREIDDLRATYEQRFQSIVGQHHQVGTLLAEALNLPGAAMTEVLKLRTSGATDDAERLSKAINSLREFMNARGDEVFQTLIRFDEMQKHVSV